MARPGQRSKEQTFAERLRDILRSWGFDTWLDVDDIPAGITPSDAIGWQRAILNGIKGASAVIGVITPDSIQSDIVLAEWESARQNKKRLILVRHLEFDLADLPAPLCEITPRPEINLRATPFYTTAYVQWNVVSDPSVAGYHVYRRTATGSYPASPTKRVLVRGEFSDYNLTPGQTYFYKVVAINGAGTAISEYTPEISTTLRTSSVASSSPTLSTKRCRTEK